MRFYVILAFSFLFGAIAFFGPFLANGADAEMALLITKLMGYAILICVGLAVLGLYQYKRRGLWFVVPAVMTLIWPAVGLFAR